LKFLHLQYKVAVGIKTSLQMVGEGALPLVEMGGTGGLGDGKRRGVVMGGVSAPDLGGGPAARRRAAAAAASQQLTDLYTATAPGYKPTDTLAKTRAVERVAALTDRVVKEAADRVGETWMRERVSACEARELEYLESRTATSFLSDSRPREPV
jgi:hypothetical protein